MRNPRNLSTTRRPRSVVELCAGIRGGWRGEGKRRAGMQRGHDGQRFYHPVEFIKKIRCSWRQHLIRCHAQRHEILLDLFPLALPLPDSSSLSPSHFHDLSITILLHLPHRLSHFTPFVLNGFDRGRQKPKLARFSRELY